MSRTMVRPGLAAATVAIAALAARGDWPPGSVCELQWADRARTSSLQCISCHDGSTGPGVSFTMSVGSPMSHPIEIDYADTYAAQPGTYAATAALPSEVPLVDGKVACTSCHDGASSEPKHVAKTPDLCLACHRL